MTIQEAKETTIYFVTPTENSYNIEKDTYYNAVMNTDELVNTPTGIRNKYFVEEQRIALYTNGENTITESEYDSDMDDYYYMGEDVKYRLAYWSFNKTHTIGLYDNEEDAEEELFGIKESYFDTADDSMHFFSYNEIMAFVSEEWNIPMAAVESYFKHKQQVENRRAEIKKQNELIYKQQKEKLKQDIYNEANNIIVDDVFRAELQNVYDTLLQGENKSKKLSIAFNELLQRNNIEKIKTDYWQVFKVISKK